MRWLLLLALLLALEADNSNGSSVRRRADPDQKGSRRQSQTGSKSQHSSTSSSQEIPMISDPVEREHFKNAKPSQKTAQYLTPASLGLDHAVSIQSGGHDIHLLGNEPVKKGYLETAMKAFLKELDGKAGYAFVNTSGATDANDLYTGKGFDWKDSSMAEGARYLAVLVSKPTWDASQEKAIAEFSNRHPAVRIMLASPVEKGVTVAGLRANNLQIVSLGANGDLQQIYPPPGPKQSQNAKEVIRSILTNSASIGGSTAL